MEEVEDIPNRRWDANLDLHELLPVIAEPIREGLGKLAFTSCCCTGRYCLPIDLVLTAEQVSDRLWRNLLGNGHFDVRQGILDQSLIALSQLRLQRRVTVLNEHDARVVFTGPRGRSRRLVELWLR